jgi:hypothetical protein
MEALLDEVGRRVLVTGTASGPANIVLAALAAGAPRIVAALRALVSPVQAGS